MACTGYAWALAKLQSDACEGGGLSPRERGLGWDPNLGAEVAGRRYVTPTQPF